MGPKCPHEAIARHARIVWLAKKTILTAEKRRFHFENGRSVQLNNACFAVAFRTQASTRFVTGELYDEKKEEMDTFIIALDRLFHQGFLRRCRSIFKNSVVLGSSSRDRWL